MPVYEHATCFSDCVSDFRIHAAVALEKARGVQMWYRKGPRSLDVRQSQELHAAAENMPCIRFNSRWKRVSLLSDFTDRRGSITLQDMCQRPRSCSSCS